MLKGMFVILKTSLMIAVVTLAIIGSMYVLGVFEGTAIKETLIKLMSILGIFTGASLLLLLITKMGNIERI